MNDELVQHLKSISVASYISLVSSLKCIPRRVGGDQMRHSLAVFGILLDYEIYDSISLKVGLCHDLLEDHPERKWRYDEIKGQIYYADEDGPVVLFLVEELTIRNNESKEEYLTRIKNSSSEIVKLVKGADRIHNLTDLNSDFTKINKMKVAIKQTKDIIIPMLESVSEKNRIFAKNMIIELTDLIFNRTKIIDKFEKNIH